jgi:DNA-binding MarR family transcriptional regulator
MEDLAPSASPDTSARATAAATGPVCYALAQTVRIHRATLMHQLAQLGLHPGQELMLVDIHQNQGTTQAELVARLGIEQPTVAKALTRMERTGFVERLPDPDDRRLTRLRLTGSGRAAIPAVLTAWAEVERRTTGGLTESEAGELIRLLNRILDCHT